MRQAEAMGHGDSSSSRGASGMLSPATEQANLVTASEQLIEQLAEVAGITFSGFALPRGPNIPHF